MGKIFLEKMLNSEKFEESIVRLRTSINCIKNKKVILITSTFKNEGKSQIALSLAISLSQIQKKILLLDADIRKNKKSITNTLCDYLNGDVEVYKIINNTNFQNLDFICAGNGNINLLENQLFFQLIEYAKSKYDYILIDSASSSFNEPFILSKYSDGILFVIRENYMNINKILEIKEKLNKNKKIIGAVLNNY